MTQHVPSSKVKDVQLSDNRHNHHPNTPSPSRTNLSARIPTAQPAIPCMHLIVAVSGRTTAFHRFLCNFEMLVLRPVFDARDSPTRVPVNSSNVHQQVNVNSSVASPSDGEGEDPHSVSELEAVHLSAYSAVELAEFSRTGLVVVSVGPLEKLRPLHTLMARIRTRTCGLCTNHARAT